MKVYSTDYLKNTSDSKNFRSDDKKVSKKKFCFKDFKNNACSSLNDVECFLNNFKYYYRYIHLYKFFK